MDGQSLMQGVILVRALIDVIRSVLTLRPLGRLPDLIPVYGLVAGDRLLSLGRSGLALDVVRTRPTR